MIEVSQAVLNHVKLLGRLCHTPNMYLTQGNMPKTAFQIAVPRVMSRRDNQRIGSLHSAQADYITVVLFGESARDLCARRLPRGVWINVRGRLQTRRRRKWEVVAHLAEPVKVVEP